MKEKEISRLRITFLVNWVFWTKWFARTCRITLNKAITDVRTKHNFIGGEGLSLRIHMPFSTRKTKPEGMLGASKSVRLFNDPSNPETTFFQSPEGSILRFLCWKSCRRNKFGLQGGFVLGRNARGKRRYTFLHGVESRPDQCCLGSGLWERT